ncbi:MAG: RHS repeat domain-containing protein, partial [Phycisphaerae bacterium]
LYALQDANWNITAVMEASGTIVERFLYKPYGQSMVLDANFGADSDGISDYAWEYRFTSREFDGETGLNYFRARFYHDEIGRFVSRDPMGFVDGSNMYSGYFVPNALDPTGNSEVGDLETEWNEWGEILKKTTDLKERKVIQQKREDIRRKIKIIKEYESRIRKKLRNNEGRGGGGRRGGGGS